jgi:protein SCO1/2
VLTGFAIVMYFREERSRMERKRIAEQAKGIGKPKVGGPFNLVDHEGRPFTDRDMRGKYSLVWYRVEPFRPRNR